MAITRRAIHRNTTRTIEADVRDNEGVRDVWVVIYPPSYEPLTSSEELVQEVQQSVLMQSQGGDRYVLTYPGFVERGTYSAHIHAVDEDGLEAAPVVLEIEVGGERRVYLPVIAR